MNLPHEPGQLSNSIWSLTQNKNSEDIKSGHVVGQNNYTGSALVSDGNFIVQGNAGGQPSIGAEAKIVRPNSTQNSRTIEVEFSRFGRILKSSVTLYTTPKRTLNDINACGTANGFPVLPTSFPPPREEPPEEPDEEEPEEEEETTTDPLNPLAEPEFNTLPSCKSSRNTQWFRRDSIDAPCPLGLYKAGFFIEPNYTAIWIQCNGPATLTGDGCPKDASATGWSCIEGVCQQVPGGQYLTQQECLDAPCLPATYNCTSEGCTPVYDGSGTYPTLSDCRMSGCVPTPLEEIYYFYGENYDTALDNVRRVRCFNFRGFTNVAIVSTNVVDLTEAFTYPLFRDPRLPGGCPEEEQTVTQPPFIQPFPPPSSFPERLWVVEFSSDQGTFGIEVGSWTGLPTSRMVNQNISLTLL